MASVFRRRTSKNWSCAFRDEHGRQHLISTKTDDRKLALVICQEFEKAAKLKRTKQQTQRTIDRLHEMISGERISRYSLREYAGGWLKSKKHETRGSTFDFYRKSVDKALAFFKLRSDVPLTELSRANDNWFPLLAITQVAGEEWKQKALAAVAAIDPGRELVRLEPVRAPDRGERGPARRTG